MEGVGGAAGGGCGGCGGVMGVDVVGTDVIGSSVVGLRRRRVRLSPCRAIAAMSGLSWARPRFDFDGWCGLLSMICQQRCLCWTMSCALKLSV